jgi:hypothetical protein
MAARTTLRLGVLSGEQITAATITEIKVIRKFNGRISSNIAVSFSVNLLIIIYEFTETYEKKKI